MKLATAPNFRDIGGGAGADGRLVRRGLIFRSEAVLQPSEEDIAALRGAGIVLVCDLRSDGERSHAPNRWWAGQGVELLGLDILGGIRSSSDAWTILREDPSGAGALRAMRTVYRELPTAAAPHLATIFDRIARGDVPLLVHCTAGKDRTGFICTMILEALGVAREEAVADYLSSAGRATETVIDHTRRMVVSRVGSAVSEAAMAALIGVERDYIEASFERIEADFGSIPAYLERQVGLDPDRRAAVRARLLA